MIEKSVYIWSDPRLSVYNTFLDSYSMGNTNTHNLTKYLKIESSKQITIKLEKFLAGKKSA